MQAKKKADSITDLIASIQRYTGEDPADQELRESMEADGWKPELPAIQDENGLILSGNSRLAVANALGIEPCIITRTYGAGEDADKDRLRLFIAANAGSKPWSMEHKKAIARFLKLQKFSYAEIGELLRVSERQARDYVKDPTGETPDEPLPDNRLKLTAGPMEERAKELIQARAAKLRELGVSRSPEAGTFKEIAARINKEFSLVGKDAISEQPIRKLALAATPKSKEPEAKLPTEDEPEAGKHSGNGHGLESKVSSGLPPEQTQLYSRRIPTVNAPPEARVAAVFDLMAAVKVTLDMLTDHADAGDQA